MSVFPAPRRARVGRPKRLKLRGGGIALAALLISALALTFSAGAQDGGLPGNTSPYADPQPCGPGAGDAFMPEPHEITEGHFALFDAYWEDTSATESVDPGGKTGILHTNTCPPTVSVSKQLDPETEEETTVTTLSASTLDIEEAIFHVQDVYQAKAVDGAPDNSEGTQISLTEYPELDRFVDANDTVWWLQLDDPDTDADETSNLTIGFSTRNVVGDEHVWHAKDGGPPLRYRLEVERYPGHSDDHPHFLAYKAPKLNDATHTTEDDLVWSSANAGVSVLELQPGTKLEDLQWIFTHAGTYEIWVELVAHVRQYDQDQGETPPTDWEPISPNKTETSEVKRYVFHVGNKLAEVEPALFGLNLTVPENSGPGTVVSPPLPVLEAEADKLYYTLSGDGSDQFALETTTNPHTVQIVVAEGANLDYETTPEYELRLSVTDKLDHESNKDLSIDDVLGINIEVKDEPAKAIIDVSKRNPVVGDTVTFTARVTEGFGQGQVLLYSFLDEHGDVRPGLIGASSYQIYNNMPSVAVMGLRVYYYPDGDLDADPVTLHAHPVTVTWSAP